MTWVIILLFVVGVCFGSFLSVVILRSAKKKQFVSGRSFCPKCKKQIAWYDNIPLLSFLLLRGKCRKCHEEISIMYPVIEVLTGVFFVWWFLMGFSFFKLVGSPWSIVQPFFWLGVGMIFIVIFVCDLLFMIIPFGLNIFLFFWTLLYKLSLVASGNMRMFDFWVSLVCGIAIATFFYLANKVTLKIKRTEGFGLGDIYLAPSLGLLMGWPRTAIGIFVTFVFGSVVGLAMIGAGKLKRTDYLPLAPFLILGTVLSLIWGSRLWEFYVNLLV